MIEVNQALFIAFLLVLAIVAIGGLAYSGYLGAVMYPGAATSSLAAPYIAPREGNGGPFCASDIRVCPDGSLVGRALPTCAFVACGF